MQTVNLYTVGENPAVPTRNILTSVPSGDDEKSELLIIPISFLYATLAHVGRAADL